MSKQENSKYTKKAFQIKFHFLWKNINNLQILHTSFHYYKYNCNDIYFDKYWQKISSRQIYSFLDSYYQRKKSLKFINVYLVYFLKRFYKLKFLLKITHLLRFYDITHKQVYTFSFKIIYIIKEIPLYYIFLCVNLIAATLTYNLKKLLTFNK